MSPLVNVYQPTRDPVTERDGTVARPWREYFKLIQSQVQAPIDLADPSLFEGVLGIAQGGTNSANTPTAGAMAYGTGTALAWTIAGTAGQVWKSHGTSGPTPENLVDGLSVSTTGTINALAVTAFIGYVRMTNASVATIQGIAAGYQGQVIEIRATNAQVDLVNQASSGPSSADKIITNVGGADMVISLAAGVGRAVLVYDATTARWIVVLHEQGAAITPTFAAGDYTASAGNWTLTGGDVTTAAYYLRGTLLTVWLTLITTTVSATPATLLRVIPGGFTAAKAVGTLCDLSDNGTASIGKIAVAASGTALNITRQDGATFATATNTTAVTAIVQIEVQ